MVTLPIDNGLPFRCQSSSRISIYSSLEVLQSLIWTAPNRQTPLNGLGYCKVPKTEGEVYSIRRDDMTTKDLKTHLGDTGQQGPPLPHISIKVQIS